MRDRLGKSALLALAGLLWAGGSGPAQAGKDKSPLDELPKYIRHVTRFGQRADRSHDGKRILFLEKTFGDAYEVELETNVIRPMTHRYYHEGYTRALYLANGDILLSGARQFDAKDPIASALWSNATSTTARARNTSTSTRWPWTARERRPG